MKTTRSLRAFTLVELLVVVSIIALLISMVLPSMRKSKDLAKRTQCLARLKGLVTANLVYIGEEARFPPLNNLPDDGTWQYNYLIYDGVDFNNNFGPLAREGGILQNREEFYCPTQTDPYHRLATPENPWPFVPLLDTRAGYGRRYGLSGKNPSQLARTVGFAADVFHLPDVVQTAHKIGLNAVYSDGHGRWVPDDGSFTDNDLSHPFDVEDNAIIKDLWAMVERETR